MRKVLDEYESDCTGCHYYDRKGRRRGGGRKRSMSVEPYIRQLVEMGNEIDGLPCYRCGEMILPGEYCYSKSWQKGFLRYCHKQCIEKLYYDE